MLQIMDSEKVLEKHFHKIDFEAQKSMELHVGTLFHPFVYFLFESFFMTDECVAYLHYLVHRYDSFADHVVNTFLRQTFLLKTVK